MISFFAKLEKFIKFFTFLATIKCWFLPSFSVQTAPDCILEYLNFQNFQRGACPPGPPTFSSRLGRHSSLALSRQYYTYSPLCPTKGKNRRCPCHFAVVWLFEPLEWPEATEDALLHAQPAADCLLNKVFKVPP